VNDTVTRWQEKDDKAKNAAATMSLQDEVDFLKKHAEFLVRSRAEERERRLKETKKRKASEQLIKALRKRWARGGGLVGRT
jgi:hypothetical protein